MYKKLSILLISLLFTTVHADEVNPDQYNGSSDSSLENPYTVSKTFYSMAQVVGLLNSQNISTIQKNRQQNEAIEQPIRSSTTIRGFINIASQKFGYSWALQGNTIVFTAQNPIIPRPTPSPNVKPTPAPISVAATIPKPVVVSPPLAPAVAVGSNLAPAKPTIIVTNNWTYSPNDKYISATLNRWAKQANYQLVWQTSNDFGVQSSGSLGGSFKAAVNDVLKSFRYSEHPLKAQWYQNNVVVITDFNN